MPMSARTPPRARSHKALLVIGLLAGHALLAVVMRDVPYLGLAHALACVAVGVVYTATTRDLRNVVPLVAYLVGCEVLWRMTKVSPFWEFGKFATLLVLITALARMKWKRNRGLAIAYFALLLPSAVLTLFTLPIDDARQQLSFNLSAPLLITIAVLFFSNIKVEAAQIRAAFIALVIPTVGIAVRCYLLAQRARLEFFNASNDYASGGFGANQVSAVLGLATMFLLFLSFERKLSWKYRAPFLALALIFAVQAILTFARGGIVLALAGSVTALFFMLRGNPRARISILVISVVCALVGKLVIEPELDELTEGKLSVRYGSFEATGRDAFAQTEVEMFLENPVLGTGPGVGIYWRLQKDDVRQGASHTEYTRMLGEHGVFGIMALGCLVILAIGAVRSVRDTSARGLAYAFIVWFALFLAVYGTRIAAPAFVFGLAFALRNLPPAKARA